MRRSWSNHRRTNSEPFSTDMTCHTSVRRLTAALHNPQGHSHHRPYVSQTGHSLCLWRSVSNIYWCGQQRRLLAHKLSIVHIIKMAEALLGRRVNYGLQLKSVHSDTVQRLAEDRCFRQDVMLLSFIHGSMWSVSNIHNLHLKGQFTPKSKMQISPLTCSVIYQSR